MSDNRVPLDLSGKQCFAMRDFAFAGKRYSRGDRFPWRQLSCSIRKARQLFDNRLISSGVEEAPVKEAPKLVKIKPVKKVAEPKEPAQEPVGEVPQA